MLFSKKMNESINQQIGNEFGASLQYVAIASHFVGEGLPILSEHFYKQAAEERDHAMRFVKYVVDAGGHVDIPAIPAPTSQFKNVEEAVKLSLAWEINVTKQINDIVDLSQKEHDHTTENFMGWFVNEQLEEVSSMDRLLKVVRRAGDNLIYVEEYIARLKGGAGAEPAVQA